jgi:endoglucanase
MLRMPSRFASKERTLYTAAAVATRRLLVGVLLLPSVSGCGSADRPGQTPADGSAVGPLLLRRGINLGDALDAPTEGDWGVTLQPAHFQLAAAAGFDHVRLPARFSGHALTSAPFTIDETFLQRVEWCLDQAAANDLAVLIDMHAYDEIHQDPAGQSERFVALWRQLAVRFAQRSDRVAFELLNEPHDGLTADVWNTLAAQALAAVRETSPDRLVVIGGVSWSSAVALDDLTLPGGDAHLLATFHGYEPTLFSTQGAPWMGPEFQTVGVVFPGPPATPLAPGATASPFTWVDDWFQRYNTLPAASNPSGPSTIRDEMAHAASFASRTSLPILIGEFAAVDWADLDSRARFYAEVRAQAEAHGFGWTVWDDGGHNKFLDVAAGTWSPELHTALFGGP